MATDMLSPRSPAPSVASGAASTAAGAPPSRRDRPGGHETGLRRAAVEAAPLGAWVALVLAGHVLAAALLAGDPRVHIGAPPLVGGFDVRLSWSIAGAVAIAGAAVAFGPAIVERLRWRSLVAASWLAGAGWIVALGVGSGGGLGALAAPLQSRYEYLPAVSEVGNAGSFLQGFVDALPGYPTHVRGHPPGMVLLLWLLDHAGLGGAGWAAALVIGAGAAAAPAALVAMRALAGEGSARRAALFVTLAPAAVWLGTSADALFCGTLAVGVALLAVACTTPRGRRADVLALAAGLVLGCGLLLSYGLAPLGLVALAVAIATRGWRALAVAATAVAAVLLAFGATGFWWTSGLQATQELYASGVAARRPYLDFLVISPAAFALALGPAAFAGLARLRLPRLRGKGARPLQRGPQVWHEPRGAGVSQVGREPRGAGVSQVGREPRGAGVSQVGREPRVVGGPHETLSGRAWILPASALAALIVAELSGLSKGETERIWLPFAPWLLLAAASLRAPRAWLAAQLTLAIALQIVVLSPW